MAAAVAREGEIIWEVGVVLANREKNIPASEHSMYPLASISKPFTASGPMILVERGWIDLDSPINDYRRGQAGCRQRLQPQRKLPSKVTPHSPLIFKIFISELLSHGPLFLRNIHEVSKCDHQWQ